MNVGQFVFGLLLLAVSTGIEIVLRRHLDHPANPRSAPGTAMILLVVNLVQVTGLVVVLVSIFGRTA